MGDVTPDAEPPQKLLAAPVPLTATHDLAAFDCGVPALDDWLKLRALKNESRFSRTYVVRDGNAVVAYFCIAAGSVERSGAPGKVRRNAPDVVPVSVIGRLAVSRAYAGRGLGADILSDALRRIAVASQSIGIAAVLVQAKNDDARRFYMACAEFIEYPADSRTLFLPIETVIAAFS
jgi:GNAT superfamily N-acetyltransferase